MPKVDDQIADIERKMEQHRNRLKDLKAQATKQERKNDARRKLLYGAAYLSGLETLSSEARRRSLERVELNIMRPKDREFLGLIPLEKSEPKPGRTESGDAPNTPDLPFDKS